MGLPLSVISQVLCRINVFSSFALGEQWNHPSTSPGLLAFISNLGAGGGWRAAPQPWTSSRHTILLDTEDAEGIAPCQSDHGQCELFFEW